MVGSLTGEEGEGAASVVEEPAAPPAADPGGGGEVLGEVTGEGEGDADRHSCNLGKPAEDGIHGDGRGARGGTDAGDQKSDPIPATEEAEPGSRKGNRRSLIDGSGFRDRRRLESWNYGEGDGLGTRVKSVGLGSSSVGGAQEATD